MGYCRKHYRSFKKYGTPFFPPREYPEKRKCLFCDQYAISKNLCDKRYRRLLHKGDANCADSRQSKRNEIERMLAIIKKITPNSNGYKIWPMGINSSGYGHFSIKNKSYNVSRLLFKTVFPGDYKRKVIRHKCDIRSCCNIDHLECGTQKDNIHNIIKRNRGLFGNKHRHCKLSENQVIKIRKRYIKGDGVQLAKEFGISQFTIYSIVKFVNWRHLS